MSSFLRLLPFYTFSSGSPKRQYCPWESKEPREALLILWIFHLGSHSVSFSRTSLRGLTPAHLAQYFDACICHLTRNMMQGQVGGISRAECPGNLSSRHITPAILQEQQKQANLAESCCEKETEKTHPFLHGATGIAPIFCTNPFDVWGCPYLGNWVVMGT